MFGCGAAMTVMVGGGAAMTVMVGGGAAMTMMVGGGTAMTMMVGGSATMIVDQPKPWRLSDDVSDSHARTGNRSILLGVSRVRLE
jgi:ABC-type nickel/cobalt efflux system permease component RcnA